MHMSLKGVREMSGINFRIIIFVMLTSVTCKLKMAVNDSQNGITAHTFVNFASSDHRVQPAIGDHTKEESWGAGSQRPRIIYDTGCLVPTLMVMGHVCATRPPQ